LYKNLITDIKYGFGTTESKIAKILEEMSIKISTDLAEKKFDTEYVQNLKAILSEIANSSNMESFTATQLIG